MYYKKTLLVTSFLIILSFLFIFNTPNTKAMTVTEIQALVQQLQQQITQLQKQLDVIEEGSTAWCHNFNIKLRYGDTGNEVNLLQLALEKEGLYVSLTDRNNYFGNHTAAAVVSFQEKYADDVLAHWGLKNGTGYVGSTTLNKLNEIYGCREKNEEETLTTPQLTSPASDSDKSLWDWDYCSSDYLCNTGEGDCDRDSDCSTGYCASNVGRKYGQTSSMDICEGKETESITVISPNGGEEWKFGETYNITWDSTGVEDAYLYLWFENGVTCKLADVSAGDGTYSVKIEENMQCSDLPSTVSAGQYKILIYSEAGMALKDLSDDYFTLIETEDQASSLWSLDYCSPDRLCNAGEGDCDSDSDCSTGYCASNVGRKYGQTSSMDVCEKKETEFITVTSPNGGEEFQQGSNIIITWDSNGDRLYRY